MSDVTTAEATTASAADARGRTYRLAFVTTHFIPYQVPLFRRLAQDPRIQLHVYAWSDNGRERFLEAQAKTPTPSSFPPAAGYSLTVLRGFDSLPKLARSAWRLWQAVRRESYDALVVTSYGSAYGWATFLVGLAARVPMMASGHSIAYPRPWWKRLVKRVFLPVMFRRMAAFLPQSTASAELYGHYGAPRERVFLFPFAVDNDYFRVQTRRLRPLQSQLKRELGFAPDTVVILFVGHLVARKRPLDVLRAAERLDADARVGVLFVGDGPLRGELEACAAQQKRVRVICAGRRSQAELPRFYAAADLFVLPSEEDPWGAVVNEAMCAGLPVVTTSRVGAARDIVRAGENGFVYPAGDVRRLADVLTVLVAQPAIRDAMGRRSLEIISTWTYDRCVEAIHQALERARENPAAEKSGPRQADKLHLGCGLTTPAGWVHLDGSWNTWLAQHPFLRRVLQQLHLLPAGVADIPWPKGIVVHDVRKPLPFPAERFVAVYASHLLEHLYHDEAKRLLRECFRVLRPGGVLRMVVPDLRVAVVDYLQGRPMGKAARDGKGMTPAQQLNRRLRLRPPGPPRGNLFYRFYSTLKDFHTHKWMYDADSLIEEFCQAGFSDVREMTFRQSRLVGIEEVEEASRVLNGEGIIVEGIKPQP